MATEARTLQEAGVYFTDQANCREYLVARRWPEGVTCPRCGSDKIVFLEKYNRWQCSAKHAARQFTAKTGTIMEDSPIGLDKWPMAMWLIVNCKNGISSYEIRRAIGVTQKTAWFLDHRIRMALHQGSFEKLLSGESEADETFIGGKARNMHKGKRAERITGAGTKDKSRRDECIALHASFSATRQSPYFAAMATRRFARVCFPPMSPLILLSNGFGKRGRGFCCFYARKAVRVSVGPATAKPKPFDVVRSG